MERLLQFENVDTFRFLRKLPGLDHHGTICEVERINRPTLERYSNSVERIATRLDLRRYLSRLAVRNRSS